MLIDIFFVVTKFLNKFLLATAPKMTYNLFLIRVFGHASFSCRIPSYVSGVCTISIHFLTPRPMSIIARPTDVWPVKSFCSMFFRNDDFNSNRYFSFKYRLALVEK